MSNQNSKSFDLFGALKQIDSKNKQWFLELDAEEQKKVAPIVLMQWMAMPGASDFQTVMVNEMVNPYVFTLYKHPELLCKLLVACSDGHQTRYKWTAHKKQNGNAKHTIDLLCTVFDCSRKRANELRDLMPEGDIILLAHNQGYQKEDIKLIEKENKRG